MLSLLSSRPSRVLAALVLALLVGTACVSRNVEKIDAEEAAELPPPPPPVEPSARAESTVEAPGVDGTVSAGPEVEAVPSGVLFVILRVAGREGGAPLAVKQLAGDLPVTFRITEEDSMIPGTPLVDAMDLTVRLDQDGNAFTREPGDLEGRAEGVAVGDQVEILLAPAEAEPGNPSG